MNSVADLDPILFNKEHAFGLLSIAVGGLGWQVCVQIDDEFDEENVNCELDYDRKWIRLKVPRE